MILTQSRVGIGTDFPKAMLHVAGVISSSGPVEYLADIGTNVVFSSPAPQTQQLILFHLIGLLLMFLNLICQDLLMN